MFMTGGQSPGHQACPDSDLLSRLCARVLAPDVYERLRPTHLAHMIDLRRRRRMRLAPDVTVLFENQETVLAQLLEQLRAGGPPARRELEREARELLPLVPRAGELRATFMIDGGTWQEGHQLSRRVASEGGTLLLWLGDQGVPAALAERAGGPPGPVLYLRFAVGSRAAAILRDPTCDVHLALQREQGSTCRAALRPDTRAELASDLTAPLADDGACLSS